LGSWAVGQSAEYGVPPENTGKWQRAITADLKIDFCILFSRILFILIVVILSFITNRVCGK